MIYGQDPGQSILAGVLASMALPPWFAPVEKDGQMMVDGAVVSNLPIGAAVTLGATEIIALDLDDPRPEPGMRRQIDETLSRIVFTATQRHRLLETATPQTTMKSTKTFGAMS